MSYTAPQYACVRQRTTMVIVLRFAAGHPADEESSKQIYSQIEGNPHQPTQEETDDVQD